MSGSGCAGMSERWGNDGGMAGVMSGFRSGWLEGSVGDVAELARLVSVPQSAVNAAASALEAGIDGAVGVLNDMERLSPVAAREVAGPAGDDGCAANAADGLRDCRQRDGVSRPHRAHAPGDLPLKQALGGRRG